MMLSFKTAFTVLAAAWLSSCCSVVQSFSLHKGTLMGGRPNNNRILGKRTNSNSNNAGVVFLPPQQQQQQRQQLQQSFFSTTASSSSTTTTSSLTQLNLLEQFGGLFGNNKSEAEPEPAGPPPTVINPDYRLAASTAGATLLLYQIGLWPIAIVHLLITILFAFQTSRIRFLMDTDAVELLSSFSSSSDDNDTDSDIVVEGLSKTGENIVVGGANRWKYDSITNWKFFPSESVKILFYFREVQTKPEGQIHFFPVLCNGEELLEQAVTRNIPRLVES